MASTTYLRDDGQAGRGREAERPSQVPLRGWKDVLVRVKAAVKADDVSLLAAGVAFYALLSLVPVLVALVSIYGLVADPADIERHVGDLLAAAPTEVREMVSQQLSSIVEGSPSGLQVGAVVGLVVALWSASAATKNLMVAVNRAYHQRETRGMVRLRATALALMLGFLVLGAVAFFGLIAAPQALSGSGGTGLARDALMVARWPLTAVVIVAGLAVLYRFAPDRDNARWNWASPGALAATMVWLIASAGFSIYTANFGRYNETYGTLGAIVVVMLWLWIGSFAVIAGAELNAELERQTAVDTTAGEPRPLGDRGAFAADTIGPRADEMSRYQ